MYFQRERVDSFYDLIGCLLNVRLAKWIDRGGMSDKFTLCSKIFTLRTRW